MWLKSIIAHAQVSMNYCGGWFCAGMRFFEEETDHTININDLASKIIDAFNTQALVQQQLLSSLATD